MESEILRVVGTIARMWADNTYSSFTDSLVELMQVTERTICGPGEMLLYNKATISWHSGARNQIVEDAEGEWIFMLDTDHVFAPDLLIRRMLGAWPFSLNSFCMNSMTFQWAGPSSAIPSSRAKAAAISRDHWEKSARYPSASTSTVTDPNVF